MLKDMLVRGAAALGPADQLAHTGNRAGLRGPVGSAPTCHSSSLRGLLELLLVIPPQPREPIHLDVRVPHAVADLPEAEVVPVRDLPVEHG